MGKSTLIRCSTKGSKAIWLINEIVRRKAGAKRDRLGQVLQRPPIGPEGSSLPGPLKVRLFTRAQNDRLLFRESHYGRLAHRLSRPFLGERR